LHLLLRLEFLLPASLQELLKLLLLLRGQLMAVLE
jgi:hypothetical protein